MIRTAASTTDGSDIVGHGGEEVGKAERGEIKNEREAVWPNSGSKPLRRLSHGTDLAMSPFRPGQLTLGSMLSPLLAVPKA